ncbi:DNA-directed RNA polymerase [Myxozyma melibiosi]|uniref:DNA-directed RNA polymerases I and III subunit RPAC1 n=1 Tax=Myxozyma melibiosi TaxID=54550 RepID=A0ABR1F7S2_9ASCO
MAEKKPRNRVGIEADRVTDVSSTDFPGYYPGEDHSWNLEKFQENLKIHIEYISELNAEFDLIGVDASIANAFRRIMISEIPTLAIEYVYIENNTSIIQDEVLAHRLGLIPLKANPDYLRWFKKDDPDFEPTDYDTVVLQLSAKCTANPNAPEGTTDPKLLYNNAHVYARDIVYEPQGRQSEWFPEGIAATNPDILIAKLRPGQEIDLTMHCILGIGQDHAKFSPVATASYRLLPTIDIIGEPITGELAKKFRSCFPKGVISINSKGEAVVKDARKDTVSREVLRHPEFEGRVRLGRQRDHFIYTVESTGAMTPDEIFLKSVQLLKKKCQILRKFNLAA